MTHLAEHPESPSVIGELPRRVGALGFPVIEVGMAQGVRPVEPVSRVADAVVTCRVFADAVRRRWPDITECPTGVVDLFDGVYLLPLPDPTRAQRVSPPEATVHRAAVLFGPELLTSELFQAACGQAALDTQAAATELSKADLVSEGEARRTAQLIAWMAADGGDLRRRNGELQGLSLELADTYEELSLLYRLATSLRVIDSGQDILRDACEELHQVIGFNWLAITLVSDERLAEVSGETFVASTGAIDPDTVKAVGRKLLERSDANADSRIVDNSRELNLPEVEGLATNLLIVPMRVEDRVLGVMFGGDRLDGELISSVDAKLCESITGSLTIYLENHVLYEDARGMFMGTLRALTSAIDAKDSYTHGHSERVALMARMLAEAAGLDEATCARVHLSGLVHDVGKIGVPEAVLCKPGRLTDEEFGMIKLHPQIGANIIEGIRQMADLVPGVLYHHERYDGRGYPSGLAGEEIPLFGRLIGLADAFDAMSSDRTYRAALGREKVLEEITRCAGTQFDPELAKLFVELDFRPFDALIRKHRRAKQPA